MMTVQKPDLNSKYWIKTSYGGYNRCIVINHKTGSVLPNCVGYSYGRYMQLGGVTDCKLPTCNAEDWWDSCTAYEKGQTPKAGAVMCWRKGKAHNGSDGAGHVAIVEKVNPDGSVETSESNYGGTIWLTKTRRKPYPIIGYTFQGFIYNPFIKEEEKKSTEEIAREVIAGKWGNGALRRARLEAAGYNYYEVQQAVNNLLTDRSVEKVAREVIAGKWGNGATRRARLTAAGYNYLEVQKEVNRLLKEARK